MKKIKVGYLPLYIKLYDDSNPHYRDPMVDYMHMLIKMLESQGLEVVLADEVCRIKPEFDRAAKKFNDAGVSAVITQHLAYSPSLESIEALLSLDAPIIVFDTTPDYQLLKVANYKGCISANHGIHGVQDMCNLLKRNGKPYYLCVGHALHSEVVSEVVGMCRAAAVKKAFQTEKVGSVGGSFTGMGDFLVSDERYKNDIGVEVQYMTTEVVKEYLPKVTEEEIDAELAYDAAHYDSDITFQAEYREATRSGLAVRKWMQDNGLHAATVNFLTLDICGLPKMPFIECCKIMERGQGYAGEGDVLTAGLVGALLVGATVGRSLAFAWNVPAIPVHHMEGHLLAPMLEDNPPAFPFVALLVSGGHTQLISVTGIGQYELLGESIDDAAGEAFDKTAKLLGLDYPGGPMLSKMASQGTEGRFVFPRPMTDRPGLDFSFSGLKTFAANTIRSNGDDEQTRADIARAFEDAVVDTLMIKCRRALEQTGFKRLVMAGGVSANRTLRAKLAEMMQKRGGEVFYARPEFCTDNGAMIAYAGMVRLQTGAKAELGVTVRPRWPLAELPAA